MHSSITAAESRANSIKFPVPGYPHYYVDVFGSVFSDHSGSMKRLSPSVQKNGYLMLGLWIDKKQCWQYVHALVAMTFHGERPENMVICHSPDADKTNCAATNLRYASRKFNAQEWVASGEAHGRVGGPKLTPDAVREIRKLKAEGWTNADLAKKHGVGLDAIRCVLDRTTWAHVV